jgi:hypothetical protein
MALAPAVVRGFAQPGTPSPTPAAARPVALALGPANPQNPEAPDRIGLPPATIAGELPAAAVTEPERQSDWPAVAVSADGATWLAYVEWNGKDADRVLVRRQAPGGTWGAPIPLDDGGWDHYAPAIVTRGNRARAVWSSQQNGNVDLFSAEISPGGAVTKPEQLTRAPFSDFNARTVADASGSVVLVWQSFRGGRGDVYARRLTGSRWGPEIRISPSDANDWEPAVALDSKGVAWIAWDGYARGNYDVFLRSLDGDRPGPVLTLTTEPTAQFHASLAVDRRDRVWVAWDEAGANWGKDFSAVSQAPDSRGLHYSRSLAVRVVDQSRVMQPAADMARLKTGRMGRYAELPHLAFDGSGTLWMVFRHWTLPTPHEIYHFYATRLTADGWSVPLRLGNSSGQNTQHVALSRAADGQLQVLYASDGRGPGVMPKDQVHSLIYRVYQAVLPKSDAVDVPLTEARLPTAAPADTAPSRRERAQTTAGGKRYTLMYGDCHRHTDVRGHSGVDGSALDTYRYALDAAQLDFMGLGDHNEVLGGRWPDGLRDYQWWWEQKAADLFTHPPVFVGLFSYEHSMARPAGHRNIIFLKRGAPLRLIDRQKPDDNLPPNLWKWVEASVLTQPGQKVMIVPHTFGAGPLADWKWPNPTFDGLLEMYQGARGSYEAWNLPAGQKRGGTQTTEPGHFAQDALAVGNRYGFVCFSDHGSTHNSFAGVWVDAPSREGILDAMLARRTFAASDEIMLDVSADGHAVGEEFTTRTVPTLRISARAPDLIRRIDVVRDGQFIWTQSPNAREFRADFRDNTPRRGGTYYYVRLFQRDAENPDGDPEIAWASPFYVNIR